MALARPIPAAAGLRFDQTSSSQSMKIYMFGVVTGGFSLRKRNQLRGFGKGIKCSLKVQQQQPPPPSKSSLFQISIPGQEEEEGLTLVFLGDQGVGKTSIITSCTVTSTTVIRFLISPSTLID
ncbi:hypothetical protein Bca101_051914 [Brassica carinata]